MTARARYRWLIGFAIVGVLLAIGAWQQSPGEDPDNQVGCLLAMLCLAILSGIYISTGIHGLYSRLHPLPQPTERQIVTEVARWRYPEFWFNFAVGWFVTMMLLLLIAGAVASDALTSTEGWIMFGAVQLLSIGAGYAHARQRTALPVEAKDGGHPQE